MQASIFLLIKCIPVVSASSLREQTRMRYECFEWVVVAGVRGFIIGASNVYNHCAKPIAKLSSFPNDQSQQPKRGGALTISRTPKSIKWHNTLPIGDMDPNEDSKKADAENWFPGNQNEWPRLEIECNGVSKVKGLPKKSVKVTFYG